MSPIKKALSSNVTRTTFLQPFLCTGHHLPKNCQPYIENCCSEVVHLHFLSCCSISSPIYRKRGTLVLMSEVDLSRQVDLCFKSLSSSSSTNKPGSREDSEFGSSWEERKLIDEVVSYCSTTNPSFVIEYSIVEYSFHESFPWVEDPSTSKSEYMPWIE